jgi:hypothetical protein
LRSWAESKEPMLQRSFIEYCYGKPPDKVEMTGLENKTTLTLYFAHEFDKKFGDTAVVARSLPCSALNGEGTRRPLLPDAN